MVKRGACKENGRRSGQAMIICLMAIGLLTAIIGGTSVVMVSYSRMARQEHDRMTGRYLARSGLEAAMHLLAQDTSSFDSLSDSWNRPPGPGELSTGNFGLGRPPMTGSDQFEAIVDEERKLNVNTASAAMLKALIPDIERDEADIILQRRARRPFATVSEMMEVAGIQNVLMGEKGEKSSWAGLLTVHGHGKINVNTAPEEVLQCIEGLSEENTQRLLSRRRGPDDVDGTDQDRPFRTQEEVREALGLEEENWHRVKPWIEVKSTCFTIHSWGSARGRKAPAVEIRGVVERTPEGYNLLKWWEK